MSAKTRRLIVIGAATPTIIRTVEDINQAGFEEFQIVGFLDNNFMEMGDIFYGYPIIGGFSEINLFSCQDVVLINTIAGSTSLRRKTTDYFLQLNYKFTNIIHPSVNISHVELGCGNLIYDNVMLHPFVSIGSHNVISSCSGLAHESRLGDYVFIGPASYICGKCDVGSGAYIGVGAKILPRLRVGIDSIIGAGSIVTASVPDSEKHFGIPARKV